MVHKMVYKWVVTCKCCSVYEKRSHNQKLQDVNAQSLLLIMDRLPKSKGNRRWFQDRSYLIFASASRDVWMRKTPLAGVLLVTKRVKPRAFGCSKEFPTVSKVRQAEKLAKWNNSLTALILVFRLSVLSLSVPNLPVFVPSFHCLTEQSRSGAFQ